MDVDTTDTLPSLYEADEVAWLEAMADLVREGRHSELDYQHLSEYLADMARRDRKEVRNRLIVLLMHLLKWEYQQEKRTQSWKDTIFDQRLELQGDVETSGTLRNHAEAVLPEAYARAVKKAADETKLPAETFPAQCPYTMDQLLSDDLLGD